MPPLCPIFNHEPTVKVPPVCLRSPFVPLASPTITSPGVEVGFAEMVAMEPVLVLMMAACPLGTPSGFQLVAVFQSDVPVFSQVAAWTPGVDAPMKTPANDGTRTNLDAR